jgi:surfactin synthase thioesterase subunit
MAPYTQPALVIIPGSFSTAQMYYGAMNALEAVAPNLPTYVSNLPSAIRNAPEEPATLQDDAAHFRGIIEKIAEQDGGRDVILMGHSYGGVVATETVKGVTKHEREAKGLKGGVVRIVYMAAHAPPAGVSMIGLSGPPPSDLVKIGEVSGHRPAMWHPSSCECQGR